MDSLTTIAPEPKVIFDAPPGLGLLGEPSDELTLRICGGARQEESVRLSAKKCTIGSDPACTLHLADFGVRPLHCLILRGQSQTIVRRFSPETRLNGADFTDAVLQGGDRLTLGPLEVEVLAAGATSPPLPAPPLEPDRTEELRSLERELAEREQTWKLRCEQREAEFAKWQKQLLARREELESERRALDADRAAFSTERQDWETVQDEARARLSEKLEQADHRLAELAAERQSHERRRSAWASQRQNLTDELNGQFQALRSEQESLKAERQGLAEARAVQESELSGLRAALEAERLEWSAQRSQLEAEAQSRETRLIGMQQEIDQRHEALAAERGAFEERQRAWEAERQQCEAQLALREAAAVQPEEPAPDAARWSAELEADRRALADQREAQQRREQEFADRLAAREQEVEQILVSGEQEVARLQSELAAERQAFETQRQSWAEEQHSAAIQPEVSRPDDAQAAIRLEAREREIEQILLASEQELTRLQAELAAERQACESQLSEQTAELASQRQALEEEQANWLAERRREQAELTEMREQFERERAEWQTSRADRPAVREQDASSRQPEAAPSRPAPKSTADLLSRFGIGTRGGETQICEPEPETEPAEESPVAPAPSRGGADEAEEDSIDDYMVKLMERLGARGASSQPQAEAPREAAEPPPPQQPAELEPLRPAATLSKEPGEMAPRAVPAELSSDMSAMRALANQNAQAALDTHARRAILKRGPIKIFLAFVAIASAGLLLWFHVLGNELALTLALSCMLVALAYVLQFVSLRRGARPTLPQPCSAEPPAERDPFSALRVSDLPNDDAADPVA